MVESPDSQQRLAELRRTVDDLAAASSSPDPGLLLRLKAQLNALQVAGLHDGEQARLAALYHVSSVLGSSLQLAEVLNQVNGIRYGSHQLPQSPGA